MQAEHLDVVADVADDVTSAGVGDVDDAADEARPADAAREDDDVHATLLSSSTSAGLRARADAQLQPREVLHRVDVVGEVRHRDETASRPSAQRARKRAALPGP